MISPKDIHPDRSLYAVGAAVIAQLGKERAKSVDADRLYTKFAAEYAADISYSYYIYALDWLFLIGLIEQVGDGMKIKRCS